MKWIKLFESFLESPLHFEAALLLKLDNDIKAQISKLKIEEGLFPLPEDKLHVTLTSIKGCKDNKAILKEKLPSDIVAPKIILGKTTIAERPDTGKKSFVVAVENGEELKAFVDSVYSKMGLVNPEPERFFHITVANNVENKKVTGFADPFGSIGDITKNHFM